MRRARLAWLIPPLAALALTSSVVVLAQGVPPARGDAAPPRAVPPLAASARSARDAGAAAAHDAGMTAADRERRAAVVARVGDATITVGELEDLLNEAPPPVRAAYAERARQREFLESTIQTMLLADEAR